MTGLPLQHYKLVDPRAVWPGEAANFTPWLAREENIAALAETLHLVDIEVEATEKAIGSFSADIVARDRDGYVLIENQLEQTDHSHLGQILTYLAGLDGPTTVIWIATRVREEHRAAVDWLNGNTPSHFSFFAIELEVFRIGDSPVAPHFNVVAKPNDWSRQVSRRARELTDTALNENQKRYLEYWTAFANRLYDHDSSVRAKPTKDHWWSLGIGRTGFSLTFLAGTRDQWIGIEVFFHDDPDKLIFEHFLNEKEAIEADFGEPLDWERLEGRKGSRVRKHWRDVDPMDQRRWPEYFSWYLDKFDRFRRAFAGRIRDLDLQALAETAQGHQEAGQESPDGTARAAD